MKLATLDNLSSALGDYFKYVKDPAILQEAMDSLNECMAITEEGHPYKPMQLNNLAVLYRRRYQVTKDLKDVEDMIHILKEALQHSARTVLVEKLAIQNFTWATLVRFQRTNNLADLDANISYHERALEIMQETDLYRTIYLTTLAESLEIRYREVNNIYDHNRAIDIYQRAALNPIGIASQRFMAAISWATALRRLEDPGESDGYGLAIELLATVAWIGETVSERHQKLSTRSSLVNDAASAVISWSRLDLAIQWLEEGRNIVWSQLNTIRTPLDDLHEVRQDLAGELRAISKELDELGSRSKKEANRITLNQKTNIQAEASLQRELAEKWSSTIDTVRTLEGFEGFLRPAKVSKLLEMERPRGTIVTINVSEKRCDALAIRHDSQEIVHIPLDDLTYGKRESLRRALISCLKNYGIRSRGPRSGRPSDKSKANIPFEDILIWLWVLVPSHTPPRLWWCATGPLAFLPIHAAGIYTGNDAYFGSTTSDYVVSSYTPTLNALFFSFTAQSTTKSRKPPDRRGIQNKLQSSGLAVEYLEGMKATINKVNPTKSAFYFHDGNLELSTLIGKQFPNADFAFLSACETGTDDEKLPEEAVHLAAGVLQAGYRSVIATMWAIDDNYAAMVSECV
ncbi:hypothetical protein BDQ17DRAFT_1426847 [Cyathus striatus]|nr:hypothetical protein BDQ17DRAFT_1426847 [Cyathus striatus]